MRLCSRRLKPAIEPAPDKPQYNPVRKEWKVALSCPFGARSERATTAMGTAMEARTESSRASSREGCQVLSRGFLVPLDLKGVNSPQMTPE